MVVIVKHSSIIHRFAFISILHQNISLSNRKIPLFFLILLCQVGFQFNPVPVQPKPEAVATQGSTPEASGHAPEQDKGFSGVVVTPTRDQLDCQRPIGLGVEISGGR